MAEPRDTREASERSALRLSLAPKTALAAPEDAIAVLVAEVAKLRVRVDDAEARLAAMEAK